LCTLRGNFGEDDIEKYLTYPLPKEREMEEIAVNREKKIGYTIAP
jgi:hypothetical protein